MKLKKKLKSLSREDAKKWWKGNAKFVFALVSAFFVIVSFAVKDDYRDHVKSLADSIDRAEDTFVLTAQNQRIYNFIKHAGRQIDVLQPSHSTKMSGWIMTDKNGRWVTTVDGEVRDAELILDSTMRLAGELPENQAEKDERARIQGKIKEFDADWAEVKTMKPQPLSGSIVAYTKPGESYWEKAMAVDAKCSAILTDTQELGSKTLQAAKEAREKEEHLARKANIASYVITVLAAGFTLAGVVLGIEISEKKE
jgi:hypothetical protein